MDYQDFTIDVRSLEDGRFESRVASAPIRETSQETFSEPVEREVLERLSAAFDRPGAELQQEGLPPELSPREIGERLYGALFQGGIGRLFQRCRAVEVHGGGPWLRLRLRFDSGDPQAEYLAALPWEWLSDPKSTGFLATDLCTPVVRDLATAQPFGTLAVVPPLRILVVDAAPGTMKQLDLKLEIERMAQALDWLIQAGQVELRRLPKTTPEALRDALRDEEIHVLHFMGHGGYDPGSGYGAVFFVGEDGKKDQVGGPMLASYLKRIPSLRLVVLNACSTARYAGRVDAPLHSGVAAAVLTQTGVPAVIANQYSISDPMAVAFSETLYGRIASGDGVDAALTEVRLRLEWRSCEWATPVLFLSSPDGKLFAMEPVRRERTEGVAPAVHVTRVQPEAEPVRLGVRSFEGWGGDMEARNDAVLDLVDYFAGRPIKEKAWWQEKVFPELRAFLNERVDLRRPLLLDFAAHSSIAFAAGWLLEPKSGLDVRVRQRIGLQGELEWSPTDGREYEGALWLNRQDVEVDPEAQDVAAALSVSQPDVADHVRKFIRERQCSIGRIVDAVIAPEPGPRSVLGGAHALALAQALLPRVRLKRPHERGGSVHFFCAAPNALVFYLGQLCSSLEGIVLYEFPYKLKDAYGRYQKSIELPSPDEAERVPEGW